MSRLESRSRLSDPLQQSRVADLASSLFPGLGGVGSMFASAGDGGAQATEPPAGLWGGRFHDS